MRRRRLLASVLLGAAMFVLPACDGNGDDRNIIEDPRGGNTQGPGEDDAILETPTDDG